MARWLPRWSQAARHVGLMQLRDGSAQSRWRGLLSYSPTASENLPALPSAAFASRDGRAWINRRCAFSNTTHDARMSERCLQVPTVSAVSRCAALLRYALASVVSTRPWRHAHLSSSAPTAGYRRSRPATNSSADYGAAFWLDIPCATCASESQPPSSTTSRRTVAGPPSSGTSTTGRDFASLATVSRPHARRWAAALKFRDPHRRGSSYPHNPRSVPQAAGRTGRLEANLRTAHRRRRAAQASGVGGFHPVANPTSSGPHPQGGVKNFSGGRGNACAGKFLHAVDWIRERSLILEHFHAKRRAA